MLILKSKVIYISNINELKQFLSVIGKLSGQFFIFKLVIHKVIRAYEIINLLPVILPNVHGLKKNLLPKLAIIYIVKR